MTSHRQLACLWLAKAMALKRSTIPDGDLVAILEVAVTENLERLESKRFGKTKKPKKTLEETDTSPSSRHIPAAVKRAVCERDGDQCTFVDGDGRRCKKRHDLAEVAEAPTNSVRTQLQG